jgi:hypothetical protein
MRILGGIKVEETISSPDYSRIWQTVADNRVMIGLRAIAGVCTIKGAYSQHQAK